MADLVTVFHPYGGFPVEVSAERAETLRKRGYLDELPTVEPEPTEPEAEQESPAEPTEPEANPKPAPRSRATK